MQWSVGSSNANSSCRAQPPHSDRPPNRWDRGGGQYPPRMPRTKDHAVTATDVPRSSPQVQLPRRTHRPSHVPGRNACRSAEADALAAVIPESVSSVTTARARVLARSRTLRRNGARPSVCRSRCASMRARRRSSVPFALGATAGTEVIVPAYTWNATPNAVPAAGAVPVLAEVDDSLTLDPLTSRPRSPRARGRFSHAHARRRVRHGCADGHCQASWLGGDRGRMPSGGRHLPRAAAGRDRRCRHVSLQFNKIITTGEGGMFVCKDEDAYFTAIDVHD